MVLNDIFQKPINRQIEGVIKADDEENLRVEFEEYVLTNEVAKRLEQFLGFVQQITNKDYQTSPFQSAGQFVHNVSHPAFFPRPNRLQQIHQVPEMASGGAGWEIMT